MRRFLIVLGLGCGVLVSVLVFRALRMPSTQVPAPVAAPLELDAAAHAERLGAAIRLQTISPVVEADRDPEAFRALHRLLATSFPQVHGAMRPNRVNELSLLYRWEGSDPQLPPALLAAHLDVVPVEPGTEADWKYPPYSGAVAEGAVWGRGTLDDKLNVMALLEAVEGLLGEGFQPRRTFYLAFGHDEEVGGAQGAGAIADQIAEQDQPLAFVLDEGGAMVNDMVPGLDAGLAIIGVAEKGYVSFELIAREQGGHSSMPNRESAVVLLARAIDRLNSERPPARITPALRASLETLGAESPFLARIVLANLWLFEPLLIAAAARVPSIDAMLRTTTAPTILEAGVKDNVIPAMARAVVNFRILPGETSADVRRHIVSVIDDDRIEVKLFRKGREPSAVSRLEGPAWDVLARTIRSVFPETIVVPYLVAGGTDARHYLELTRNVYRFSPMTLTQEDRSRLHGTNERIFVDNYLEVVRFYRQLIQNLEAPGALEGATPKSS